MMVVMLRGRHRSLPLAVSLAIDASGQFSG